MPSEGPRKKDLGCLSGRGPSPHNLTRHMEQPINYVAWPGIAKQNGKVPTPERMVEAVLQAHSEVFGTQPLTLDDMRSKARYRHLTEPRHMCMAFLRTTCRMTALQVGRFLHRDHASAMYGHRKTCELSQVDVKIRNVFDRVSSILGGDGYHVEAPHYVVDNAHLDQTRKPKVEFFRHDRTVARHGYTIGDLQFSRR